MIRPCDDGDFEATYAVINDAAGAYRGVIPEDRWHEPYMSRDELRREIRSGVRFWGYAAGWPARGSGGRRICPPRSQAEQVPGSCVRPGRELF